MQLSHHRITPYLTGKDFGYEAAPFTISTDQTVRQIFELVLQHAHNIKALKPYMADVDVYNGLKLAVKQELDDELPRNQRSSPISFDAPTDAVIGDSLRIPL